MACFPCLKIQAKPLQSPGKGCAHLTNKVGVLHFPSFPVLHHPLLTTSSVFSVFQTDFEKDVDMACRSGEHITGENQQVTWFGDWTRPIFFFPFCFLCVCLGALHVLTWVALPFNPGQKKVTPWILPLPFLFSCTSFGLLTEIKPCIWGIGFFCHVTQWQRRASRKKRWDPSLPTVILLCSSNPCWGDANLRQLCAHEGCLCRKSGIWRAFPPLHLAPGTPGSGWISPLLPAPFSCVLITEVPLDPEDVH